jgi:hypothetical protein
MNRVLCAWKLGTFFLTVRDDISQNSGIITLCIYSYQYNKAARRAVLRHTIQYAGAVLISTPCSPLPHIRVGRYCLQPVSLLLTPCIQGTGNEAEGCHMGLKGLKTFIANGFRGSVWIFTPLYSRLQFADTSKKPAVQYSLFICKLKRHSRNW